MYTISLRGIYNVFECIPALVPLAAGDLGALGNVTETDKDACVLLLVDASK